LTTSPGQRAGADPSQFFTQVVAHWPTIHERVTYELVVMTSSATSYLPLLQHVASSVSSGGSKGWPGGTAPVITLAPCAPMKLVVR